jgi:hypothetical protein
MMEAPIIQVGQRLLNGKKGPAGVGVESFVEMLRRGFGCQRLFDKGRAGENHIDLAFSCDGLVSGLKDT